MKAYIGPYINRWTTSRFEHWCLEKLHKVEYHWEVKDKDYTKLDRFIEKFCDYWQVVLNYTINLYLDRKKRKIKIEIDYYDTWSLDHTLAYIALPMLKQLRDTKHGSPFVNDEDVPEGLGLRSTEAPPYEECDTDDNFHKRWEWVLDEMIWAFEQIVDDDAEHQFHTGNIDIKWTPVDEGGNEISEEDAKLYRMDKGPYDTSHYDQEGHKKWNDRIQRGTTLFGKYYRGLWD